MQGLLSKLKNKHFLSLMGNGIMSVFGLVTISLLYHSLSVTEIGIWVFFQSTILLIETFRSGFITTAFIKFYAGTEPERAREIMGSTWYIALAITVIFILLNIPGFFLLPYITNPGLQLFIKWFSITYICTLPSFIAMCVVQGEQRFDRLLFIRFVSQVLFVGWICVLIFLDRVTLINVVYANLCSSLVTSLVTLFTGFARVRELRYRTRSAIREMVNFGKFSVGTTLSSNLFRASDVFIINFMLGPAALAIYNLGQRLMEIVEIPLRSFAATAMPSLSSAYNRGQKEEVIYILKKYAGIITVLLVPVCIVGVLLADIAIAIIGGSQYAGTEAANVFRLFMTFALLFPADRYLALTLDVIHKPHVNFVKVLIMLAVNITGDFVGILILGNIYGVALTTFIPILIGVLIGYYALRQYQPFAFFDIYRLGYAEVKMATRTYLGKLRRPR
ncbi:MAG: oligosaccharide flippase family protein [Chitinophagaceae bacterium]